MDEKEIQHVLIEILYAVVNDVNDESIKNKITPDVLQAVYLLAKKHDLAHLVSNYVYKNNIKCDDKLQLSLQREEILSVYRTEQMKSAFRDICSIFDKINIAYIPLKGAVIRPYYPYDSMRTSCDIDILIHEEDLELAIKSLIEKGYKCGEKNYHDVSLYAPNKTHLELHFSIKENMECLDVVLKDAWRYAKPITDSQYAFSEDFFAFYIFAHMAYHFLSGGCGIRSLLDIWVMENKMEISYICAKDLLQRAGIYQFAVEISKLAELCFTQKDFDSFYDSILKYIFCGGVYGTAENYIAVKKTKSKTSLAYVFKRLFPPLNFMRNLYQILIKAPIFLPICWVIRGMQVLFGNKSKRIISEMSQVNNMSEEKMNEVSEICLHLGL